jgi:DNA-binding NtrC family response regulator
MKQMHLTSAELETLILISKAVFANPFSDERIRYDMSIAELPASTSPGRRIDAAVERVETFLKSLARAGKSDIRMFNGPESELLTNAHLFVVFHRYIEKFDQLILEQIAAGDSLPPVSFSAAAITDIESAGISRGDAIRYFSIFYQLRRAFYFIDRALLGRSSPMKQLRLNLWNNVFTHNMHLYVTRLWNRMEDFSTLLLGETGTGKGTAASAIGRSGYIPFDERSNNFTESFTRSFIPINLSQFQTSLIESELFGHKKGAFTGAIENHQGVFSRCSPHGAIFIDEIGDVSAPIQIKLLQVLQERIFSPVGSHDKLRFNGRVIAATNRSMDDLRQSGIFRDDFFYRLSSDVIVMPSLRARLAEDPSEIDDLLTICIERITGQKDEDLLQMIKSTISANLGKDYEWRGNVRELEQCVRRILLSKSYKGDRSSAATDASSRLSAGIRTGSYTAQQLMADYCHLLYQSFGTYEEVARRTGLDRRTARKYAIAGDTKQ